MSLNWNFKNDFYGVMTTSYKEDNIECKNQYNLYDGNALMIACFETNETYQVCSFFVSKEHMKNCLGLSKDSTNMYKNHEIKLVLKPNKKSAKTIAEAFIKAKFKERLTIIFTDDIEPIDSTAPFNI